MYSVAELFAGVGGFRLGFENANTTLNCEAFKVVWSNQWEPSTKTQHASDLYVKRWGLEALEEDEDIYINPSDENEVHSNKDISKVDVKNIPSVDLICGGFPCQDYSVAKNVNKAKGLEGKKGVLWWEILRIAKDKMPKILFLENVDRLLKSPAAQRGRDFAVMLASLDELGYVVEWRSINAADYGMPQRRRRVFILAYLPGTELHENLSKSNPLIYLRKAGVMAKTFPIKFPMLLSSPSFKLRINDDDDLADISEQFNTGPKSNGDSPFEDCGIMKQGTCYTFKTKPRYKGEYSTLNQVIVKANEIPEAFILEPEDVTKEKGWIYQKGAKSEERKGTDGFTYNYSEGAMNFPDPLDQPSRTIITGEGGSGASRFKHVVIFKPTEKQSESIGLDSKECQDIQKQLGLGKKEWLRRLIPLELERLNMFPDNHTLGVSDSKRAFLMGNALVIDIISLISTAFIQNS